MSLDFETIFGQTPFEGLFLNTQYRDSLGVSFILESGDSPVFARVGPPAAAFGSLWGLDTPAPGQNVGQFFLADDGILAGLQADPIIIEFSCPVSYVSASILDVDFAERFTVEGRGEDGQIVEAITFREGDPGTGDGLATAWEIETDPDDPGIFSVRIAGQRTTPGAFGLAVDNLVFCRKPLSANLAVDNAHCNRMTGSIKVASAEGAPDFVYSLSNGNYSPIDSFPDLDTGKYLIYFRDANGCPGLDSAVIEVDTLPIISTLFATDTKCGEDNGSIGVIASGVSLIEYALTLVGQPQAVAFQPGGAFTNLSPGSYAITIRDENGCKDSTTATIAPSIPPTIEGVETELATCHFADGSVSVFVNGGTGTLLYAIDNGPLLPGPQLTGLPAGMYTVVVQDSPGCRDSTEVEIQSTPTILWSQIVTQSADCAMENGLLVANADGGSGQLTYTLDNAVSNLAGVFDPLGEGEYLLSVSDEAGCFLDSLAAVGSSNCPIYIPNVFSPNGDQINDVFSFTSFLGQDIVLKYYRIFDRWGEQVYEARDFSVHSDGFWWNGDFNGERMNPAVYAYVVCALFPNGEERIFAGDVTLVR